jgi:RNA polymerase sigma-70 factor (ECF subfamily)
VTLAAYRTDLQTTFSGGELELDEVTLRRAQSGDETACRALVDRYQRPVFALLGRMLGAGRGALVEDLAQETFLDVFRALARFSALGPARLSTWILTIASRRAIDAIRSLRQPGLDTEPLAPGAEIAGPDRTDGAVFRGAVAQAIQRAVAELAPEYRAAFLLREYHGLDYAEISRALEIDVGTVKSRLHRARAALRAALAEVHDD